MEQEKETGATTNRLWKDQGLVIDKKHLRSQLFPNPEGEECDGWLCSNTPVLAVTHSTHPAESCHLVAQFVVLISSGLLVFISARWHPSHRSLSGWCMHALWAFFLLSLFLPSCQTSMFIPSFIQSFTPSLILSTTPSFSSPSLFVISTLNLETGQWVSNLSLLMHSF